MPSQNEPRHARCVPIPQPSQSGGARTVAGPAGPGRPPDLALTAPRAGGGGRGLRAILGLGLAGILLASLAGSTLASDRPRGRLVAEAFQPSDAGTLGGVHAQASIDATGSTDVSSQLQSLIDSAPDGSTIVLKAGGTYRLGKALRISGRRDLTLEGNGARLNLTGTSGTQDSVGIVVRNSTGTAIRNLTMVGNNSEAGTSAACCSRESQHGIAISSATDTLVEGVDISRVWGDCLYVNATSVGGTWSDGVTFRYSTCRLTGRHGLGLIRGSGIRVVDNVFDEIGFNVVAIEPGAADAGAGDVVIRGNAVGSYGLGDQYNAWLLAACGASGSAVRDVTLTGNAIEGNRIGWSGSSGRPVKALSVRVCGDGGRAREGFVVTDNVGQTPVKGPALNFTSVRGVTVTGNRQPLTSGQLASFPGSTGVTYVP